MIRTILKLILSITILNVIAVVIPDSFTSQLDTAVRTFVGAQYSLQPYINVSTLLNCEQILMGFLVSLVVFVVIVWMNRVV